MRKGQIHFQEVDTADEVARIVNEIFGELRLISGRITDLERRAQKPEKKKGIKGMVAKIILIILLMCGLAHAQVYPITWDACSDPEQLRRLLINRFGRTGGTFTFENGLTIDNAVNNIFEWNENTEDLLWTFASDAVNLSSTTGVVAMDFGTIVPRSDQFLFDPVSAAVGTTEGTIYYDSDTDTVQYRNASAWVSLTAGTGDNTLDDAYRQGGAGVGAKIDADDGPVEIETADGSDDNGLHIDFDEADTGTPLLIESDNATADTPAIDIDGQTTGRDIEGTGASFYVTGTGAIACVGLTNTAGDILFDDTYDVSWDTSRDQLLFEDNAVLGIGGAHDAAADVTFMWDTSNLLIESAAEDTGEIRFGSTNAIDVAMYGNTNTNIAMFNANTSTLELNGYDLQLQDGDFLMFGDGDDFTMDSSTAKRLDITPAGAGDDYEVLIGSDQTGVDLGLYGASASNALLWDASDDRLEMTSADILMDDASVLIFGTNSDFSVYSDTANTLEFDPSAAGDGILFGTAANDAVDITWYSDTTGSTVTFDEENITVNFGASDTGVAVHFYGDTASQQAWWDHANDLWYFGDDAEGVDVVFNGDNTGNYVRWDENLDTMVFVDGNQKWDDDMIVYIGTGTNVTTADGDFTIQSVSDTRMDITATAANSQVCIGDGSVATDFLIDNITTAGADIWFDQSADSAAGTLYVGVDNKGIDLMLYGETTGEYVQWDMSTDTLISNCGNIALTTTDGEVDQFKVDATGTGAGDVIVLKTTDGGVQIDADGADNGDIEIDAADVITVIAGDPAGFLVNTATYDHKGVYYNISAGYTSATQCIVCPGQGLTCVDLGAGAAETGSTEGFCQVDDAADFLRFMISLPDDFVDTGTQADLVLQFDIHEQHAGGGDATCNIDLSIYEYDGDANVNAIISDTMAIADAQARQLESLVTNSTGIGNEADLDAGDILIIELTGNADTDDFNIYGMKMSYRVGLQATE
jgi:hypothetical protein